MTYQHLGKQNIKVAPYFGALLFFCFATFSYASSLDNAAPTSSSGDSKGAFSFAIENDLFGGGTDRHYTNGFQMAYISDAYHPEWIDTVASFVPLYRSSDNVRFGIAFGQSIFTPDNISETALITNDRPYAGWLYTTFAVTSDVRVVGVGGDSADYRYVNALDITVGIVGPSAKAEETQTQFHEWVDTTTPRGWDNQLKDELGFNIAYTRLW